ncbi:MAG: protein O-mannosyl-transferase family [Chthoniobacterales bacterium]
MESLLLQFTRSLHFLFSKEKEKIDATEKHLLLKSQQRNKEEKKQEDVAKIEFLERVRPLDSFSKPDRLVALVCFLVALITFWSTVMPNVGLGDDGEMATAALHCGIPHPSGYPLWTITAGLFSKLIPFGNGSWKLNLFSGLCASIAVALVALLSRSSARWLGMQRHAATFLAFATSLTFAWAVPVWSQATIGKGTYSLHVLLMLALTTLCYLWIRTPLWRNAFVWIVFSFSLGMSNHHMTLAMAVLPLLVILLLHRTLFLEYTIYSLLIGSALYVGFAYLSSMPEVMKAALRFFYTTVTAFFLLLFFRKKFTEWKQGLLLVVVVVAGLLPYLYMPLASKTNPPMNWSYTSTREGFFYAINRSQYWGTLADQLQSTVGKAMGIPPAKKQAAVRAQGAESPTELFLGFFKRFWSVLFKNISPFPLLIIFLALFFLRQQSREKRIWFTLLVIGFFLAAFFEPIMAPSGYDNPTWDMQKPWQGLCYGFLLLLSSYGTALLFKKLENHNLQIRYVLLLLFGIMAIYTFCIGLPRSSQRGHWFGWMFGHDMLADLPPDSFFFGGTDPGRFIPTYMIFGESFEDPRYKRDSHFDRRDLYIITQNALADKYYNQYIRSHYTEKRPSTFNWIERFLGRDHTYPKVNLVLPNPEDIVAIYQNSLQQLQGSPEAANLQTNPAILNSAIAEWIFLRNRDQHHFFVEESFPMPWTYPYAIPHGLCYEINHDPLPNLSADVVARDQQFWTDYIKRLRATKGFEHDEVAQHCFAKLRNATGNIYASRHMQPEAEFAYKQALDLWPGNTETVENMVNLLSPQERFQEAYELIVSSLPLDPHSQGLKKMKEITEMRFKASKEIPLLQERFDTEPNNRPLFAKLLQDYATVGNQKKVDQLIDNAIKTTPQDTTLLRDTINFYAMQNNIPKALTISEILANVQHDQWDVPFTKAKYQVVLGKKEEAILSLREAVKLGGQAALQQIIREPLFQQLANFPSFQELLHVPSQS